MTNVVKSNQKLDFLELWLFLTNLGYKDGLQLISFVVNIINWLKLKFRTDEITDFRFSGFAASILFLQ